MSTVIVPSASADSSYIARDLMFGKPVLEMPHTAQLITTLIFGAGALATLIYAVYLARRYRASYPIWLFVGSILASVYETYDATMGHFVYPQIGQFTVYELLGVKLPLFLILTYPFYVAALVIWVVERLQNDRLSIHLWWQMFAFSVLGAAVFEPPFIHYGLWYYYGNNQPFSIFKLPVWWMFANPAAIMCMGLLCSFIWSNLLDKKHAVLLMFVLPWSLFAIHGAISAPLYLALNTSSNLMITNFGALITIALSIGIVWLGARFVGGEVLPLRLRRSAMTGQEIRMRILQTVLKRLSLRRNDDLKT